MNWGFELSGQGDATVLLIHGVGLNRSVNAPIAQALSQGCQVINLDLPGHGESDRLAISNIEIADLVETIDQFVQSQAVPMAAVVGHSIGALISVELGARYPARYQSVVPITPVYARSAEASQAVQARAKAMAKCSTEDWPREVLAPLARWFGPDEASSAAYQRCADALSVVDPTAYVAAYQAFAQSQGVPDIQLDALKQPMLAIAAEHDINSTPVMAQAMVDRVANGSLHTIQGAKHMAPLTHSREVAAAIVKFLSLYGHWNAA
ncbi:MAG: alpha/beta hydrolase [Gammaproteobacteria bacterium]|nr:alpha/beta hydrolase [Gammaproteobacteria bacterium]